MEQTKIEVSKPILSPTRSLDEGFESDPDRISTDSELTSTQPSTFDLHHHSVRHSNNIESSSICLDGGDSESDNNADDGKLIIHNAAIKADQQPATPTSKADLKQQHMYRRMKNKAPLPPKSNSTNSIYQTSTQPRSQSVDRIQHRSSINNDFNKSSTPNANQNILAGRFVRVTVDPKQQYLNYFKNYKSYQNYHHTTSSNTNNSSNSNNSINGRLLPLGATTGSTSNLYKNYHTSSNSNKNSINNLQQSNSHETSGGLLSLSNLSSSMPMQYGYSTVKSPKNYLHFTHHPHLHQQPQSLQQSHFLASSWTQSMDPRKARK
jgi:hypothetical protein